MFKFFMSDDELYDELSSRDYNSLSRKEKELLKLLSSDDDEEEGDLYIIDGCVVFTY